MATTMNPVDLYRDPTLDGAVGQHSRSHRSESTPRRTSEKAWKLQEHDGGQNNHIQQYETTGPTFGSPISYRGVGPNPDPKIHRSFSQRAHTRPFADDAFTDEVIEDQPASRPPRATGRSASANYPAQVQSNRTSVSRNNESVHRSTTQGQRSQRSSQHVASAAPRDGSGSGNYAMGKPNPVPKINTHRDAANQTEDSNGNWAPDRSPLQVLEVKLTDISKEEKRARVQEAEMRLRESQAAQTPQRSQRENDQRPRPGNLPIPTIVQPSSSTSRRNTTGADHKTSPRSALPNGVTSQSNRQKVPLQGPAVEIPIRQHVDTKPREKQQLPEMRPRGQKLNGVSTAPPYEPSAVPELARGVSSPEAMPSQIPQPVHKQKRPQNSRVSERPLSERERNASHQAALHQLTGQTPTSDTQANIARSVSLTKPKVQPSLGTYRPPQKLDSPVAVDLGTIAGEYPNMSQAQSKPQSRSVAMSSHPQTAQPGIGLGVQSPPVARSSQIGSSENLDGNRNKQRKSSVSFKEPFDTRRPVDEWKAAETARLVADDFLPEPVKQAEAYKPWWEQDKTKKSKNSRLSETSAAPAEVIDDRTACFSPPLYLKCGPLLRYAGLKRMQNETSHGMQEFWRGTIMIVTQDSKCSYESVPTLRLFSQPRKVLPPPPPLITGDQLAPEYVDPIAGLTKLSRTGRAIYVRPVDHLEEAKDLSRIEDDNGIYEGSPSPLDGSNGATATSASTNKRTLDVDGEQLGRYKEVRGARIYADPDRDVTFWRFNLEIELGPQEQHLAYRINKSAAVGFWVPAQGKTMNMMFHSCNGFSMSVNTDAFSGPDPLWRDVLNNHQTRPFHVMIGGGDQVYNDRVMADTHHFGEWTKIRNPHQKHIAPFTTEMKNELENFYLERYSMWFSQGLFGMANASIPMVNIWDDHDIIDGFGSYPDDFMKSPVFMGLGDIAHKYYLLFQHQSIDAMTEKDEPSWVLGKKPGPYIKRLSRSVYMEFGQHVAFLGMDGRTERTRDDVVSIDTLETILERCRREMVEGRTKHLIILLGVPIAYPRLVWLENVLTSRALDPIKALHRAGIVKTKLLNRFDGGVEVLDDLDDHWTAKNHKDERNILIQDLQDLAAEKSARVTILSGDVHLAAIGQFYSNPKLKIPKDRDHRYMPNVISSAIVNTPPPDMLADVLNKRNKVHHLDKYTDENMIPMFTHDVDDKKRNNTRLLPRRNWCSIREYVPGDTPPPTPSLSPSLGEDDDFYDSRLEFQEQKSQMQDPRRRLSIGKGSFNPRNLVRRLSSRGAPPNAYRPGESNQFEQRAASMDEVDQHRGSYQQSPQLRASSADNFPDVPALRPTFNRRPTNLSEKAVRKGIVPGVDNEGNEIHFNDHVNLECGLDIELNCEINQKDPAGITTQYRLLVPALWYDGSSDREKIAAAPQLTRRTTLLQKFGLNPRNGNRAAENQGAGNWGQEMSETESFTGSEGESPKPPKRGFSLFGSMRKKKTQQSDAREDEHTNFNNRYMEQPGPQPPPQPPPQPQPQPQLSAPQQLSTSRSRPPPNGLPMAMTQHPDHGQRSAELGPRQSQRSYQPPTDHDSQQALQPSSSQRSYHRSSRPLSYIIGGADGKPPLRSEYSSSKADGRPPYDPDAAYVSGQHSLPAAGPQRSFSAGQGSRPRATSFGSMEDNTAQPQQRALRGNGIIGKNLPPSSFRNNDGGMQDGTQQQPPRGYSGIEAYKDPKPRRRWSLRERARNMMGSLDARRRRDDDDWYSDEEEEAYWEGPQSQSQSQSQPHSQSHQRN